MAAPAAAAAAAPVSAQVVGNAFVVQYYHILHQSPGLVHRFYQDVSKLGRPEEDGSMSITTTMDAIDAKILSLNYGDFRAEIRSVDAQESLNGGVNVLVTGYLTGKDNVQRNFTQSFFLAPQDKGFFVLNDMFRYMENANHPEGDNPPTEDEATPVTPEQVPEIVPVPENDIPEQAAVLTEESKAEEVVPMENGEEPTVEEEEPVPEVVDEVPEISQLAVESNTKIEGVAKKSYASIVMDLKQNGVPFSSPAPSLKKPQPRNQEQNLVNALTTTIAAEAVTSNADAVENGIHEEEAEGYSVYIKGLAMNATPAMLEEEFKKFGPIKLNGIQVRSNRQQGFCFGFVEFEVADAVQKAIEASPVIVGGRAAVVEEKRSTNSKGGNRGRFVVGRGSGFRNEAMRGGRGNYGGGRGYNRVGDFGGSRNDYGYRGGSRGGAASNRGGDGFHRDNNGGGGRVNRGLDVNGSARNMAQ
ncbi:ras GTPase-activating protein-binding protein 1-like isoform X2 [Cynara cardunculus var. scolymus]|uniref:ras GTPase-activating protein-binding protein 1-like isoform X2 n=1 Tax=Cynara cardunculus var. scolymus TaxID=59895 RepID=UPI000D630082|nr:ras GTPase-activating protein-binding protein 1-like isoform X2 [Cynara cardunculus var. scolymus]